MSLKRQEMVFNCDLCGFQFNSNYELKSHSDLEHNFECPQCEETYSFEKLLREHTRNYHETRTTSKEILQCPICAKIFKGDKTLKIHMKNKHVENYERDCLQGVGELSRRQEELVEATIMENNEKEVRVARKNEERVEGLRRECQEREEKMVTKFKQMDQRQRRENKEKEDILERTIQKKEE